MEEAKEKKLASFFLAYLGFCLLIFALLGFVSRVNLEIGLVDVDKILKDSGEDDTKLNCSRPLSQLCSTMGGAVACGVTSYCIHCSWATSFDPHDASYGKCKKCQIAIKDGRYNEDLPNFDYPKNLRPICNHHILKEDADSCLSNIDHYLTNRQELWASDPLKLSVMETCSILGMCYSPFTIIVPQNSNLLVESSLKNSFGKTEATFISDKSIRKIAGVKVAAFDSNCTKYEQKFLPIFKSNSSKYVCTFMDIVDLQTMSGSYTIFIQVGSFIFIVGLIIHLHYIRVDKAKREEDEDEIDFCEDLDDNEN